MSHAQPAGTHQNSAVGPLVLMTIAFVGMACTALMAAPYAPVLDNLEVPPATVLGLAVDIGRGLRGPLGLPIASGVWLCLVFACMRIVPQSSRRRMTWTFAILITIAAVVLALGTLIPLAKLQSALAAAPR